MNKYLSQKLRLLSLITMILVLYIHSYNYSHLTKPLGAIDSLCIGIEDFIAFHICRIAVPAFFMLSAYLLLLHYPLTLKTYWDNIKKRLYTLGVPYVVWVSLWSLLLLTISNVPSLHTFVNKPISLELPFWKNIVQVYTQPICYQLWFIRDLFFLVVVSPLYYYLVQKTGLFVLIMAYLNWLLSPYELSIIHNSSLLFYGLGIALYCQKLQGMNSVLQIKTPILGCLWIGSSYLPKLPMYPCAPMEYAVPFSVLLGIAFLWKGYDAWNKNTHVFKLLEKHSNYSFFLYGIHEPLLTAFKKISFSLLGTSNAIRLTAYLVLPIVVYALALIIGTFLKTHFYKFYTLLTGGRSN